MGRLLHRVRERERSGYGRRYSRSVTAHRRTAICKAVSTTRHRKSTSARSAAAAARTASISFGPGTWPVKQGDTIVVDSRATAVRRWVPICISNCATPDPAAPVTLRPRRRRPPRRRPAAARIMRIHYIEVDSVQGVPVHGSPGELRRRPRGGRPLPADARRASVGTGRKGYFVLEASDRRNGVNNTFGLWRRVRPGRRSPSEYRMDGFTHDLRAAATP